MVFQNSPTAPFIGSPQPGIYYNRHNCLLVFAKGKQLNLTYPAVSIMALHNIKPPHTDYIIKP